MAVFTPLSPALATRVTEAHGLGPVSRVIGIAEGSVNSNFLVECSAGTFFFRIYEEQDVEGVAYEWKLIDALSASGIPMAKRIEGTLPGELLISGKPVGLFAAVGGHGVCQTLVTDEKARAVGALLGNAHGCLDSIDERKAGRYTPSAVQARLAGIDLGRYPELKADVERVERVLESLSGFWQEALDFGVIHSDLFRDNIRWQGDEVVAVLDWESASDGPRIFDLAVTVLSWCFDNDFRWDLARAMVQGYHQTRPLSEGDQKMFRKAAMFACARFATTRMTDFYIHEAIGERTHKDFKRFLQRLDAIESVSDRALLRSLGF